jgi:hypothetical protein
MPVLRCLVLLLRCLMPVVVVPVLVLVLVPVVT